MAPRVVFIGLDACDAGVVDAAIAAGALPTLARLQREAAIYDLDNSVKRLPGGIWPEIGSGIPSGQSGVYFHPQQMRSGDARLLPVTAEDLPAERFFFGLASAAGRRVAVVDMPHAPRARALNGLQLCEWGAHSRHFGTASWPESLLDHVIERYGPYPARHCEFYAKSAQGLAALRDDLIRATTIKADIMLDVMGREDWDLFAGVLTETHCAGHHLWHFHDRAGAATDDAMLAVYAAVDRSLGRVLEAAGGAGTVLCLASHGMAANSAGQQILPEVLARLGMSSGGDGAVARVVRYSQRTAKYLIPRRFWDGLQRGLIKNDHVRRAIRHLQGRAGAEFYPLENAATRAAVLPNNTVAAIRLNIRGREPFGSVAPGNEARDVLETIREALYELRVPGTDEPVVEEVLSAEEAFGPDHHPDVPDIIVVVRRDIGLVDACWSPRFGLIRARVGSITGRRTGDHVATSRLWALGTEIAPGRRAARGRSIDIAPTVLERLGVAVPASLAGRPLDLVRDRSVA